jgi:hypothetical protein
MNKLETLQRVTRFDFFPHHIEGGSSEFCTFSVETLGPVAVGARVSGDEVLRAEQLTTWASPDEIQRAGIEVNKDCTRDVFPAYGFVVIDTNVLELEIGIAFIATDWVNAVFIGDYFPELGADLVPALTYLKMHDLTHHGIGIGSKV